MLIPEWRKVFTRAWSVRFIILAGVLSGFEAILPLFQSNIPRGIFSALTLVMTIAAVIARLWAQPRMYDHGKRK